jgi:hypothetical protein
MHHSAQWRRNRWPLQVVHIFGARSPHRLCYHTQRPMKIGYARVSTHGQNLDRQIAALRCCRLQRDLPREGFRLRPSRVVRNLERALDALGTDDVLVVAEWDRATRSMMDGLADHAARRRPWRTGPGARQAAPRPHHAARPGISWRSCRRWRRTNASASSDALPRAAPPPAPVASGQGQNRSSAPTSAAKALERLANW